MEIFVHIEIDESPSRGDIHFASPNLQVILEEHNECFGTSYTTIEQFNEAEEYRMIYKVKLSY
tara:strand:+ start:554 stop:742 length:189 start_codon:yes stop_codon:yes gene_type:complete